MNRRVKRVNNFLRDQKLLAVPFDKCFDFCVSKQKTYSEELIEISSASQFEARNRESDNFLHNNLQFTPETPNGSGDLTFLDLDLNVNEYRKISCQCYQKSTDTGIILSFRSCAPLQL